MSAAGSGDTRVTTSRVASRFEKVRSPLAVGEGFRPDIEGLRAVAVMSVVLFHAGVPGVTGGFVGVDVFFVISGFLITGMLWRQARTRGTVRLAGFYGARARRLLPASAVVAVVAMIASVLLLSPLQIKKVSIDAITSAMYVSNYWFIATGTNYFTKDDRLTLSPFQHYWSLGVEEQFYLVWPVLIVVTAWLVRRVLRRSIDLAAPSSTPYVTVLAIVALVSFSLSLVITYVIPPVAYFSLPTRAWQLATGGLVALTAERWRRLPARPAAVAGWTGLGLTLLACTYLDSTTVYPGLAALLPAIGAALIIGAGCVAGSRGCGHLLGSAPMRSIGRVSYSWYLWHWPVLVLAPAWLGHALGLPARIVAALVSLALAGLTLKFIENPLRFSDRIRRRARNSLALGAAATTIAVVVGAIPLLMVRTPVGRGPAAAPLVITAPQVLPGSDISVYDDAVNQVFAQAQWAVAAGLELQAVPSNLTPSLDAQTDQMRAMLTNGCLLVGFQSEQPACVTGDPDSTTSVVLIGDSHAAMFNPAFATLAAVRGWRLEMMSKAACPIVDLPLTGHFNTLAEETTHCTLWRNEIHARIRAERPRLVVLSSAASYGADGTSIWGLRGFDPYNSAWIGKIADFVRELHENGSQVLVLGEVLGPLMAPLVCLSANLADPAACAYSTWDPAFEPGREAEAAAVEAAGGQYADLTPLFCIDRRCPVIIGNTAVFYDPGHLTHEFSELVAPAMGALSDRALAHR
jgi:peptidoglycan/LPS O-acetylase OafA/YrhL